MDQIIISDGFDECIVKVDKLMYPESLQNAVVNVFEETETNRLFLLSVLLVGASTNMVEFITNAVVRNIGTFTNETKTNEALKEELVKTCGLYDEVLFKTTDKELLAEFAFRRILQNEFLNMIPLLI